MQQSDNEEEDSDEEQVTQVSLKWPAGLLPKCEYVLFFPCFLIMYILPNYHNNPSFKKLVFCLIINFGIVAALMVLIDWCVLKIAENFEISGDLFGATLVPVGL